MKWLKPLCLSLYLLLTLHSTGQKHDYQWLFGYYNKYYGVDTLNFGGVTLDFNYSPSEVYPKYRQAGFDMCNTSYCDDAGQLVMYSNGTDIYDARDSIMQGGDSINYGEYWRFWVDDNYRYEGLRLGQSMLSLPDPIDSNRIYLLHNTVNLAVPDGTIPTYVTDFSYTTLINLDSNFGNGAVIQKNSVLSIDSFADGCFSATRHGNGKDWWILHPHYREGMYAKFLLNDSGVELHDKQYIGLGIEHYGDITTTCFSPNGEKYFWVNGHDGIHAFDFDRCSGQLSNPKIIPFPIHTVNTAFISGVAVSSNNRFLYIIGEIIAFQYDLEAQDIGASIDTIAIGDGVYDPDPPFAATFYLPQLGPDGKIYINSTNSTISLHVINRPNEKADSCDFVQRGVKLNTYNASSIPNFPNYRLGRQVGSVCDTLWNNIDEATIQQREKNLKVFPNPATDKVTVDYGFTDWSKNGSVSLEIVNELGQLMHSQPVPEYSGFQKIDVSRYSSGIYTTYIKRNSSIVAVSKFARE